MQSVLHQMKCLPFKAILFPGHDLLLVMQFFNSQFKSYLIVEKLETTGIKKKNQL